MSIRYRDAERSATHVLIGLAGPSGTGKTLSALRIARGLCPDESAIYVIDTESGRAAHYACAKGEKPEGFRFAFKHGLLTEPFTVEAYKEAMAEAIKQGAKVVIVDSMSHAHEGPGGMLEAFEDQLDRLHPLPERPTRADYKRREALNFAAWIKPKRRNNLFVNWLLQQPTIHFIFCFRAKDKTEIVKKQTGGVEPRKVGWTPIISDRLDYEMTDTLVLPPGAEGVPDLDEKSTKLLAHHHAIFKPGRQLSEDVGRELAEWSAGGPTSTTTTAAPEDHSEATLEQEADSQEWADLFAHRLEKATTEDELQSVLSDIVERKEALIPEHREHLNRSYKEALGRIRQSSTSRA